MFTQILLEYLLSLCFCVFSGEIWHKCFGVWAQWLWKELTLQSAWRSNYLNLKNVKIIILFLILLMCNIQKKKTQALCSLQSNMYAAPSESSLCESLLYERMLMC